MINSNRSHVATAEKTLKTVYEDTSDAAIAGALSDLRHLCDAKRLDFAKLDCRAYRS